MRRPDWRGKPVAGIGIIGLDHVAVTDRWERDCKTTASRYFEQAGGPVPVALLAMVRLGMDKPPHFFGAVGSDSAGQAVRDALTRGGVEAHWEETEETARSLIVLDTSDGSRTLTNYPGHPVTARLPAFQHPEHNLPECGLLHTDGREADRARHLQARYGCLLSLDLGTFRPAHIELLPRCDIVIASKTGGRGAFPASEDAEDQVACFLELGATIAGVTLGSEGVVIGSRLENGGEPVRLPPFAVSDVVDTCGAGDLFHGAFLWAYREGRTAIESANFAQAAVALRIRHFGNAAGQPTRAQVDAFLAAR